jgi:hypothetical protein
MEKHIIGRGLLAGALAGVLAFVWSKIVIEPVIGRSIGFEDATTAAHQAMETAAGGHSHAEKGGELFSRGIQTTIGMGLGVVAFSVAMGALFAVVFAVAYSRTTNISARALSVLIAGGMLVALWIVPALKYPPNPPATSLDETITQRALLYLLAVGLSALLMVAAVYLGPETRHVECDAGCRRRVHRRDGGHPACDAEYRRNPWSDRQRCRRDRLGRLPGTRPVRVPARHLRHPGDHLGDHRAGRRGTAVSAAGLEAAGEHHCVSPEGERE